MPQPVRQSASPPGSLSQPKQASAAAQIEKNMEK